MRIHHVEDPLGTRRIIGFGVHTGDVDGIALCCIFNQAISRRGIPRYLSSDSDPLFQYHRWNVNLRILDVEEIKSLPYIPLSHPFVERLIGTSEPFARDMVLTKSPQPSNKKGPKQGPSSIGGEEGVRTLVVFFVFNRL